MGGSTDQRVERRRTRPTAYDGLVAAVREAGRAVGAASAQLLDALDLLARSDELRGGDGALREENELVGYGRYAVSEVAAVLGISERAAQERLRLAWRLHRRLPLTLGALRSGEIGEAAARVLAECTEGATQAVCSAVEDEVLPSAGRLTPRSLAARVRRVVLAVDPAAADRRRVVARRRRRVSLSPDVDGMAWLGGYLDSAGAGLAWANLDARARAQRAALDAAGTAHDGLDALRADALLAALISAPIAEGPTVDESPTAEGTVAEGSVIESPVAGDGAAAGPGRAGVRVVVNVTVPLTSLLGVDDRPGSMDAVGPISAEQVRELVASGPTWIRRVLTDPRTGQLVSADDRVHRYRPTAALDRHVRLRDQHCRFPGCDQPATHADLDHSTAWPEGPTDENNLAVLCRRHHRYKTEKGWTVVHQPDHSLVWTSPCGQTYTTYPEPWDHPTPQNPARHRRGTRRRGAGSPRTTARSRPKKQRRAPATKRHR